ncbi:MAG: FKBP-type peptidyl-prolyl cis-trans isomerase [Actinomycetota bacterium]
MRRLIIAIGALAVVATACGKTVDKGTPSQAGFDTRPPCPSSSVSVSKNWGHKPVVTITADSCSAPKTLEKVTIIKGKGPLFKAGETASIQYVGLSWSTKTEFDSSWKRGQAFDVVIPGQLIQGWNEGIPGMHVGERRLLIIPPDKGYGPAGAQGVIAPNETLVFVVDLVGAKATKKATPPPAPKTKYKIATPAPKKS